MAWLPIARTPIQYEKTDGNPANGYYLKFYLAGTTTPTAMATDTTGATQLAKCKLNERGFPISNASDETSIFIPHVNSAFSAFKYVIYQNASDADANNFASAIVNLSAVAQTEDVSSYLTGTVETVETYADFATDSTAIGRQVSLLGHTTQGIGGGIFDVINKGSLVANNGRIAINGSKAYVRQSPLVFVEEFGAIGDGVSNELGAIQACHDYLESLPSGGTMAFKQGGNYKISGQFIWNPNKVAIEATGAYLDFATFSGALFAVKLRQTITDPNLRSAFTRAHPWNGGIIVGTGSAAGTVCFIDISDHNPITGTYWAAGVTFTNTVFINWWRDMEIGNGGFFVQCYNCAFVIYSGFAYDTGIYIPSALNAGENLNFTSCFFGKVYGTGIKCINSNASIICKGCSIDYTDCLFDIQGGTLDWDGYIENNRDNDYWVKVSGTNSLIRVAGEMNVTGNKATYEIFSCDSSATNGGLDIDLDLKFSAGATHPRKFITGTGRSLFRYRGNSRATVHPAIGGTTNRLFNGGFEINNLNEWALSGSTLPSRSNTYAHSGTWSLKVPGIIGGTAAASFKTVCLPGQFYTGELWYRIDTITGTSGTFLVSTDYLDVSGTSIASAAVLSVTTNVGAWTVLNLGIQSCAPPGTAYAALSVQIFGTASGAPAAYIDDVDFTVV